MVSLSALNSGYIKTNANLIFQFILAIFFIGMGILFFKNERSELNAVRDALERSDSLLILSGNFVTAGFLIANGLMYVAAFRTVGSTIHFRDAMTLFLKRNFVSVFLPAGGVTSLAFFSSAIEKKGISKSQIKFASAVYAFLGIFTVVVIAVPVFSATLFRGRVNMAQWGALAAVTALILVVYALYDSLTNNGRLYRTMVRAVPAVNLIFDEVSTHKLQKRFLICTFLLSLVTDLLGVGHLYIALRALGHSPALLTVFLGYVTAVIFMIISPFLRGLGAVEFSMTYLLTRFGYTTIDALSVTFLYRFFEFWLPLSAGVFAFVQAANKLLARVVPALLLFLLGITNIISVLTPAIHDRLGRLQDFLPTGIITASNYFVFAAGVFLLVTAAFMLKGLRTAWYFALSFCFISAIGHMTKAIDYEEALVAVVVMVVLILTRKEYYIRNNPRLRYIGVQTSVLAILATVIYGVVGFYFLDTNHFNIDFSIGQSVRYTLLNFFLIGSDHLIPADQFARDFILSINASGLASMVFLVYTLVQPYLLSPPLIATDLEQARILVKQYGRSSLDYFKLYQDKLIFIPDRSNCFLAYRISGNFAIVLENPVASSSGKARECIALFDRYCYETGVKSLYYRVPESSLELYPNKKKLFLGQEAIVCLLSFSMVGKGKKSLRNSCKRIEEKGFVYRIHRPPHPARFLEKIRLVSDEWLKETGRSEIVFSQGMFSAQELETQEILAVEDHLEEVIAFLNIIPDYVKGEGTYDLFRKKAAAPPGVMDYIIIKLFEYLRSRGFTHVNLGFAPLSGLKDVTTFPERSMKFAYEKIRTFSSFRGMREFKEKFDPVWYNRYLIYDHDFDLLQVPKALHRVIKP